MRNGFVAKAAAVTAGSAVVALLIAGSAAPVTSGLSHALSLGTSAAAAEAISTPAVPMPSFADLVAKVKPAVVSVYVQSEQNSPLTSWEPQGNGNENDNGNGQSQQNSPFKFFFGPFGGQQFSQPNAQPTPQIVRAQGSGFFISGDGYLVTNNHVVNKAKKVEIKTTGGQTYHAKIIGTDPKTDLALLKVDAPVDFPHVKLATTLPRIGDWVVAMGNPFGLGGTVTAGIVSAQGRDIGSGPYDDYLQIDAPVNSGNSGGPSFNLKGEVVGINTAIFTPSGGSVGIAFDIPSTTAQPIIDQLKSNGKVTRGWMGVTIQPVTADIAESLGLKSAQGALIDEPQDGSPAAEAGLKSRDVITALNGSPVKDSRDLARRISAVAPGTAIHLTIMRNGSERTVDLTVKAFPSGNLAMNDSGGNEAHPAALGMTLAPSSDVANARANGVVVVGVNPLGVASEKGVQQGDVIVDVGGSPVSGPRDVRSAMRTAENSGKKSILLHLKTAQGGRYVALPIKQG
jgi:serine protease Do